MTELGPLRFDAWMQQALYDPVRGYYSRQIETVGGRGDFTTTPMICDHLAHAIGKWADHTMRETGIRDLIEIGPGTGQLAMTVLKFLPWIRRRKCRLHLVETSSPLKAQQRELLGDKAVWHETPAKAMEACEGRAILYSNELVDAFPCRRFELTKDGWYEIHIQNGEVLMQVEALPESSLFDCAFDVGQRIEVHESYREWLTAWLPMWQAGRMLTIDYGAPVHELYQRKPQGSMRAYLLQQRLIGMDIYASMGRQDLTADVNFSDLIEWSKPWTQDNTISDLAEFLEGSKAPKEITDPHGAGSAFKVLDQQCR